MSLNIKDERTHDLVRELARRTGTSQTAAVREAVRARLAELGGTDADPELANRRDRARAVVADFRQALTPQDRERILRADDWLYDDDGLPR